MPLFWRYFILGTATALLALAGMICLPHDPYVRWQDMRSDAFARLGWIYERIHFDRTPIDIAFIGTSHTMNGIDAEAVAGVIEGAKQSSINGAQAVNATNLAIPAYGRNLHWLIAHELMENRKVGMLVLEILENETRKPHPLFVYPAEVSDVLGAPLLINLNYFHDIVRLPFRQISLFAKSLWPQQFGLQGQFDPSRYDGATVDNTRVVHVGGKQLTRIRDQRLDPKKLQAAAEALHNSKDLHMLGRSLENLEFRFPRFYVSQILDLAERKGIPVKFLYLPGYGQPDQPYDTSLYQGRGEMITVNDILAKQEYWGDVDHLNEFGAAELSARIGSILAADIRRPINGAVRDNAAVQAR